MPAAVEISVVIPVFNNAKTLGELASRLAAMFEELKKRFEIVFVNDGSRDQSMEILRKIANGQPWVKVISLSRNFGQHPAICAGFEHVDGEVVILMDADLQDSPEDVPLLVAKLNDSGADIVYTVKHSTEKKFTSRLTSTLYHYVFSRIVETSVPLNIGTFRAFNRKFLEAVLQYKEVNVLYGPLMFYMGFKSCFLELPFSQRLHGKSSYTFSKRLQLAVNSLISYTDIPHKASIMFGALLLAGSLVYAMIVALQYLLFGSSLPGGNTLILLVLCLTLGSVMMTLGIIGSYVFRMYQEVLNRPRYLVQEKINLS
jgi:glycosyltransferase involved in cell wall biosynthesis